jgi:hypothetical protein
MLSRPSGANKSHCSSADNSPRRSRRRHSGVPFTSPFAGRTCTVPCSTVWVETIELDRTDTIFFSGVEDGFFRDGVPGLESPFVALLAGLFNRGDERGLGVLFPPFLACTCFDPVGVPFPLTACGDCSGARGIRLRWEHPMHLRAEWLAASVGRDGDGREDGDGVGGGCDTQSSESVSSHGSLPISAVQRGIVLDIPDKFSARPAATDAIHEAQYREIQRNKS